MKKCSKCKLNKIDEKFKKDRNVCKTCINIQDKLWRNKSIYCDLLYKSYYTKESDIKKCTKCFLEKDNIEFVKGNICKICTKLDAKERHKRTYISIKPSYLEGKDCRVCKIVKKSDQFSKHCRVCKLCKYNHLVVRETKRKKSDPIYRFKSNIRSRISNIFKRDGFNKESHTFDIIGCTFGEMCLYIESKFYPWMNWDNRGLYNGELNHGWDIDHIIPLSSAKIKEDIIRLNHYTNLQPLCSKVNRDIKKNILYYENKS